MRNKKENLVFLIAGLLIFISFFFLNCTQLESSLSSHKGPDPQTSTLTERSSTANGLSVFFYKNNCTTETTVFDYMSDTICTKIFNASNELYVCLEADIPEREQFGAGCTDPLKFVQLKNLAGWTYDSEQSLWFNQNGVLKLQPSVPALNTTYRVYYRDPEAGNEVVSKQRQLVIADLKVHSPRIEVPLNSYFDIFIENVSDKNSITDGLYGCVEPPGFDGACADGNIFRLIRPSDPASYSFSKESLTYHFRENYGNLNRKAGVYKFLYRRGKNLNGKVASLKMNLSESSVLVDEPLAPIDCQSQRTYYADWTKAPKGINLVQNYGLFVLSNRNIDSSFHFEVSGTTYAAADGPVVTGLQSKVFNKKGELLCTLRGGPMLRSSGGIKSKGVNVSMEMSFDMRTRGFFANAAAYPGPHIPVVLLGDMGMAASEGIGPIFGNLSALSNLGRCSPPANGQPGNYVAVESFRNNKVCVFGAESTNIQPLTDQQYHVEVKATPVSDINGIVKNKISYAVTNSNGVSVASLVGFEDDPLNVDSHGGWLIFNVIGAAPPFNYDFWIENLKVNYE